MKSIVIDPAKCVGCRLCELACSLKNSGNFSPAKARIQVIGFEDVFCLPITCLQCARPSCARACPTKAITRDDATGVVRVSSRRCIGCESCASACSFGNIVLDNQTGKAAKCELCDGQPECVLFCPTGALKFVEIEGATAAGTLSQQLRRIYPEISPDSRLQEA